MSGPILTRFNQRVLRDKSATDKAQIPADGATADLYRQGATTTNTSNLFVPGNAVQFPVAVYDPGALKDQDLVRVGASGTTLKVDGNPTATGVLLTNSSSSPVTIGSRTRLVPLSDPRPSFVAGPVGTAGPSQIVAPPDGFLAAYTAQPRYDFIVTPGGVEVARLYVDAVGGTRPAPFWANSRDYPTIQLAIDALPDQGGEVFIPGGTHDIDPGLVINKYNVTLRGEGALRTILRAKAPVGQATDLLTINNFACRLYGLQFDGTLLGSGRSCIVMRGTSQSGHTVSQCFLSDLLVTGAPLYGLRMLDIVGTVAINSEFASNRGAGVSVEAAGTTTRFIGCGFRLNGLGGLSQGGMNVFQSSAITLVGCVFEDNDGDRSAIRGSALDIRSSDRAEILGCRFALDQLGLPSGQFQEQFLYAEGCKAAIVDGCWFEGRATGSAVRARRGARLFACKGPRFASNTGRHLDVELVLFDAGTVDAMEYGNTDLDSPTPRINSASNVRRVFGLSKGVVQLYRFLSATERDEEAPADSTELEVGAMVWLENLPGSGLNHLQILSVKPSDPGHRVWRTLE